MIVDLGAFAFFLGGPLLALGLISGLRAWRHPDGPAGLIQNQSIRLIMVIYAFVLFSLIWALVINDFDLLFVAQNTNPATPLLYKVVGVWGNHEGSLILWQLILVFFAWLMLRRPAGMPASTHRLALSLLLLIILGKLFIQLLGKVLDGSISADMLGTVMLLGLIRYLVILLPFSFFMAIIMVLSRMYKDSEMNAARAGGASPDRCPSW